MHKAGNCTSGLSGWKGLSEPSDGLIAGPRALRASLSRSEGPARLFAGLCHTWRVASSMPRAVGGAGRRVGQSALPGIPGKKTRCSRWSPDVLKKLRRSDVRPYRRGHGRGHV